MPIYSEVPLITENKKILVPNHPGNKDRIDILRYHLVCRRSDHLMQMPTHPLPHNAGIASEDTWLAPFPLPSAAHLPVRLPPCSQQCRTLCGCASDFTSASTVSKSTCGHYTPPPSVCQALFSQRKTPAALRPRAGETGIIWQIPLPWSRG